MTIPNALKAVVQPEKLTGYLLDTAHPVGGSKARFFRAHGFDENNVDLLASGLRSIAASSPAEPKPSPFGMKYVVSGDLPTPRGTVLQIETVWIIETHDEHPRLVTAYPV